MSFLRAGLSVEAGEEVAATRGLAGWLRGLKGGVAGWSEESLCTLDMRTLIYLSCPTHVPEMLAGSGWGAPRGSSPSPQCPVSLWMVALAPHTAGGC